MCARLLVANYVQNEMKLASTVGLLAALLVGVFGASGEDRRPVLTNAASIRNLSLDRNGTGRTVRVRGIITYRDQSWKFMVLQDETGGVPVAAFAADLPLAIGNRVEVEGVTGLVFGGFGIDRPTVRLIEKVALPGAKPATIPELSSSHFDATRVELTGVVAATEVVQNRALLHLHAGTNYLDVVVRDLSPADPALPHLVGARVRVQGATCRVALPNHQRIRPYLFVAVRTDIVVEEPPSGGWFDGRLSSIRDVIPTNSTQRVKILARVQSGFTNQACTVADDTGTLRVHCNRPETIRPGDLAEVVGFPSSTQNGTFLDHAMFRLVARSEPQKHAATNRVAGELSQYLPLLQSVADVRGLTAEEADQGYPVRLRGVVTFYDSRSQSLFVRDATNGIFVWPSETNLSVRVSDIIEVGGFSGAGLYAPIIVSGRINTLAAGELPPPMTATYHQLFSGNYDCERVAIDGIVRSATAWNGGVYLKVAVNGNPFSAMIASPDMAAAARLVDAEVRFHGVCGTEANDRRQIIGLKLFIPSFADIIVKEPATEDPFALPLRTAVSLFSFRPQEKSGHRVHVRGVVTMQRRPHTFFIRDATGAVFVQLLRSHPVEAGQIVEVAGFPTVTGSGAVLQDAIVRSIGRTNPPAPVAISAGQALSGNHEGDWVSIQARLLDVSMRGEQPVLVLESGRSIFEAAYVRSNTAASFKHLRPGDFLQVPGICVLRTDEGGVARSFQLIGVSPWGITILQRTPWWTLRHALVLAGGLSTIILAALAWVWMLRRQVGKQTAVIRELNSGLEHRVAERTAELEAANCELESFSYSVSHDLRAPLRAVNGFAEILLHTHAPLLDEKGSRYLRNVAASGRQMGRLVDDLLTFSRLGRQPLAKSPLDLNELLPPIIDSLQAHDPGRRVNFRLQPLPPTEGDRGLICQVFINLLGNAWKFTAKRADALIEVGTLPDTPGPVYFVKDNGAGFDMQYASKLFGVFQRLHRDDEFPGTGVGLAIVQRVIQRHGGRIWADSQPDSGATFYFTLPAGSSKNEACTAFGK